MNAILGWTKRVVEEENKDITPLLYAIVRGKWPILDNEYNKKRVRRESDTSASVGASLNRTVASNTTALPSMCSDLIYKRMDREFQSPSSLGILWLASGKPHPGPTRGERLVDARHGCHPDLDRSFLWASVQL